MNFSWKRFKADSSGATAVEGAFILPIFLLTLLIIVEACRGLSTNFMIDYALDKTSRYAMVHSDATVLEIKTKLRDELTSLEEENIITLDVSEVVNADKTRSTNISIAYNFEFIVPNGLLNDMTFSNEQNFLRF